MFWTFFLIMWVANTARAGISFHNVRRGPIVFRHSRYEETQETFPDSEYRVREKDDNTDNTPSQDRRYIPTVRRRASMQERLLRGLSKFIPRLPSFSSLNLIKRTGGFRRFPGGLNRGEPQGQEDGGEHNDGPKLQHRLGGNFPATVEPSSVPDNFQTQINEFRTGLLVSDPRINYYKISKRNKRREFPSDDPDRRLESDIRNNIIKRTEANRRRHRPRPSDSKLSHLAGPPYPGPHPRNPRLPLDKTIIFPWLFHLTIYLYSLTIWQISSFISLQSSVHLLFGDLLFLEEIYFSGIYISKGRKESSTN